MSKNPKPIPAPPELIARIRGLQQQLQMQVGLLVQGAGIVLGVPNDWVFDNQTMTFHPKPEAKKD
jgi:hypothetical protein